MVVQDASVFHQGGRDQLEKAPHASTCPLLVVDKFAKARQALISAFGAKVIESCEDWLLEQLLKLRVHLGVAARYRLENAPDGGHEPFGCEAGLLIEV